MSQGKTPLGRAKRELRAAMSALEAMRTAATYDEFLTAWQSFLDRLEKVWVKIERECQAFRARFEPWQSAFKRVRDNDELLRYLRQARHADQHSVRLSVEEMAGRIEFKSVVPGGLYFHLNIKLEEGSALPVMRP